MDTLSWGEEKKRRKKKKNRKNKLGMQRGGDDDLAFLQRRWQMVQSGSLSMNEFGTSYNQASLSSKLAFDSWRNREHTALVQGPFANPMIAPQRMMAPPLFSGNPQMRQAVPQPAPVTYTAPAPRVYVREAVGFCSHCAIGLDFDPPRSQHPLTVRCPRCHLDSSFQVCWTCPAVIPYDSTCARCLERDRTSRAEKSFDIPLDSLMTDEAAVLPGNGSQVATNLSLPPSSSSLPPPSSESVVNNRHPDEKGLQNRAGDNHCFLNVTIQSLWHLKAFRDIFEAKPVQHPPQCQCVHCALTVILTNYRYAASQTLAPDVLRRSLGLLYSRESKFQIGELSDATECFDAICTSLHHVATGESSIDAVCDPLCSAHSSFRLLVEDRCACKKCGHVSSDVQSMFLHYSYASEIVRRSTKKSLSSKKKSFESILHKLNVVKPRSCAKCDNSVSVQRLLLKPWPKVFALCIAWADPNPPVSDVTALLSAMEMELDIGKVFDEDPASSAEKGKRYKLRGIICYYLKHYAAYFYNDKEGVWFSFDDVSVQEVGSSWRDVMKKCRMGHQKPVLVFYEELSSSAAEENSPAVVARHRNLRDLFRK